MRPAHRWPATANSEESVAVHAVVCLHCEWRVLTTEHVAHYELARLEVHLDECHEETLAGKVGFYAPSPGLILEHFRVERAEADPV